MSLLGFLGLGSGGNKSSSTATTTANADNRQVNDGSQGGFVVSGTGNVVTDGGAVAAAQATAMQGMGISGAVAVETGRAMAGVANNATAAAVKAQQLAFSSTDRTNAAAFKLAGSSEAMAFSSMDKALGAIADAYSGARGDANAASKSASQSQQTAMWAIGGALALVAVLAFRH